MEKPRKKPVIRYTKDEVDVTAASASGPTTFPTIRESIDGLVSEGVKDLVCVPLFIAMGLHLGDEIPEQIGIPPYSDGGELLSGKLYNFRRKVV